MIQISFIISLIYNKAPLIVILTLISLSSCNFSYKDGKLYFHLIECGENAIYSPLETAIYDTLDTINEYNFNTFISVPKNYYN